MIDVDQGKHLSLFSKNHRRSTFSRVILHRVQYEEVCAGKPEVRRSGRIKLRTAARNFLYSFLILLLTLTDRAQAQVSWRALFFIMLLPGRATSSYPNLLTDKRLAAFRADGRTPRLAGGVPAVLGELPYLVASLHPEVRCTATIISSCWLLGAAHCYVVDGEPVRPCEVTLVAGVVDFLDDYAPSRQDRVARRIFIHPNFEEKKLSSSDLSLIRVDPFKFDAFVGSIKLSGEPFQLNCEVPCYASGFGDNFENSTNTRLLKLPVKAVQSKKVCHGLKPYQRKNMLCLQQDNGKGLCDGDSGGPLVCSNRVVGVAHQVYTERFRFEKPPDMECGATGIVHTYMFTCPFLDWIRSYVPEAPPKPPKCFRV